MIPATRNGLPSMACVSAMQKCVRRGMEREAMEFAVELMHTSKAFASMVCKRLQIISHEDIDTAARPDIVPFVRVACEQALAWYDAEKMGGSRLAVGNAIRMMCRAPKSRLGDHFAASIGLRSLLEGFVPTIPDFALDKHTLEGKKLGRGLDHFRAEGAKLVPPPTGDDPYEDEAYRLWAIKERGRP
ncbi:replication-associated recombination protein RarA [Bradyrhizobium sp. USDA 4518]